MYLKGWHTQPGLNEGFQAVSQKSSSHIGRGGAVTHCGATAAEGSVLQRGRPAAEYAGGYLILISLISRNVHWQTNQHKWPVPSNLPTGMIAGMTAASRATHPLQCRTVPGPV
jgi:hypothetical protein